MRENLKYLISSWLGSDQIGLGRKWLECDRPWLWVAGISVYNCHALWICVFGRYLSVLIGQVAENVTDLGWFGIVSIYKISVNPDVSHTLDPHHILYCVCWFNYRLNICREDAVKIGDFRKAPLSGLIPESTRLLINFHENIFNFLVVWTLLVEDFKTI